LHWTRSRRWFLTALVLLAAAAGIAFQGSSRSRSVNGRADEVHLSWVGSPETTMAINWHTASRTSSAVIIEEGGRWRRVQGHSASPQPLGRGAFHEAEVTGLRPGSTYRYAVSDVGGMSRTWSFTTAPAAATKFRFDAFADQGDCQSSPAACRVIRGIVADQPAFVLGAGDLSYANEHGLKAWDRWLNAVQAYAADVPLMPAVGNHEFPAGDPTGKHKDPITNYKGRFALPTGNGGDYYSFDYGGAHFVALPEVYVPMGPGSAFRRWLESDLAAADRNPMIRWKIAFDHRPFYSSGTRHGSYHAFDRNELPILEKHGVDLVISGHEHNYERTLPTRDGTPVLGLGPLLQPALAHEPYGLTAVWLRVKATRDRARSAKGQGTIYVVTGGGGANVYNDFGPMPSIDATRAVAHEHLRVDIRPQSLHLVATSDFGKVIDEFTITAP
jgi:hypothetical protein